MRWLSSGGPGSGPSDSPLRDVFGWVGIGGWWMDVGWVSIARVGSRWNTNRLIHVGETD